MAAHPSYKKECDKVGQTGHCGPGCVIFFIGECDNPDWTYHTHSTEEVQDVEDSYDRAMKGV